MLNNISDVLDEILQTSKNVGNVKGLGYGNQVVMITGIKYVKLSVLTSAKTSE